MKHTFGSAPKQRIFSNLSIIDRAVDSKIDKQHIKLEVERLKREEGIVVNGNLSAYNREAKRLVKKPAGRALETYKAQTLEQQMANFNSLAKTLHLKYGHNTTKKPIDIKAFKFELFKLLHPTDMSR